MRREGGSRKVRAATGPRGLDAWPCSCLGVCAWSCLVEGKTDQVPHTDERRKEGLAPGPCITSYKGFSVNSIRLWRCKRIDTLADEMRDKLSIVVVNMAEQPGLDEFR